jgi:hypothetical protein
MAVWPAERAVMNRDDKEDSSPPSAGEVARARALGVLLLACGAYGLYLILTGAKGVDGVQF